MVGEGGVFDISWSLLENIIWHERAVLYGYISIISSHGGGSKGVMIYSQSMYFPATQPKLLFERLWKGVMKAFGFNHSL